jgi:hypothetical protein
MEMGESQDALFFGLRGKNIFLLEKSREKILAYRYYGCGILR